MVIGHVTIRLGMCGFLLVVHCNHASTFHRYGDMGPQTYWDHDLDLLGSRDVIGPNCLYKATFRVQNVQILKVAQFSLN